MLFNSLDFAIFLPIVFILYWLIPFKNIRVQNLFILAASYLFYGWWNWRFLSLILFSTIVDYCIGLGLSSKKNSQKRKALLTISILVNLGLLGVFKYYNFFLSNFISAFSFFGIEIKANSLNIVLPVGISFYTFQTLSYTIDVYKRKLEPTKDFILFATFVSFFPQLVAGPIERATHLLPQFYRKRVFDYSKAVDGLCQIFWGLFKKMVIADNCAEYANSIFNNSSQHSGSTLILGAIFFTFQIYGDFSGYSDIAIGTSKLFGFDLMNNFASPYFSRDVAEFWRRWHISLSTWFRDYLYIPLGGSRGTIWTRVRNTFIVFIVSGFWHGASWNFIVWGALNAIYFLPLLLTNKNRHHLDVVAQGKLLPTINELFSMLFTFALIVLAWIFFRAKSLTHAISYLSGIYSYSIFAQPQLPQISTIILIILFLIIEWCGREHRYALHWVPKIKSSLIKYFMFYLLLMSIIIFMSNNEQEFIYFQF
ncbi:MAG: MBOAT family protein [Crocosphaera sp.]